ncbi:hypothetical protein CAEBREN_23034 [Caenorhabditis brenneri]|uniref:Uncharacterized protein n=1 Tax=Caenorhabditis brenneri TaxID=135651 RepID=G0N3C3_CAEBE|nr:hypothetical protein CAEBREN_23034 [Caenorhabditis brenneri]
MVLDSAKKWWSGEAEKGDGDGTGWNLSEKLSSAASKVRDCSESAATSIGNSAKSAWNSETVNTTATIIKESTFSAANSIKNGAQAAWNSEKAATVKDYSGKVKTKVDEFNAGLMATKEVKYRRGEVDPTKENGWRMMGSAASTIKNASLSAASTVGSSTKAAWNSKFAASASSAVKNGISSAGSEVKSWWSRASEKTEDVSCEKVSQQLFSRKMRRAKLLLPNFESINTDFIVFFQKNHLKMSDKGRRFMGSAASTAKDYTFSAATSVGNTAKSVWNSDAVANTTSAIKNTTETAASSIGNSAKAAWNSELAASAKSAVKNGISSAGIGVKSWWNRESEKSEESSGDTARGGIAAISKNASEYIIKTTGKISGILKIIDKTNYSPYGKPQWWNRPRKHININKAINGINDLHIPISLIKAKTVGAIGKVAEKAKGYAPILTKAAITTRNTIKTVATTTAIYTSGSVGASAGAAIRSLVAPGRGAIFGGIAGGLIFSVFIFQKYRRGEVEPTKGNGWRIMGSAASAVKNASLSAASTVGSSTKAAWNSEFVASASSAVKNASLTAASTVGSSTKAAWNSEFAASASSAVKNGISSAGNGVKSWWSSKPEKTEDFSCKKKNQLKMSDKGWGFMGSAASTVKDYTFSAASSVGNTAKRVWNSDAAASTTSAIKNTTETAASSIGNTAKAVWNSEFVASAPSAIKNGISSAGSGQKNWWNRESEKSEESSGDTARGGIAAISKNASEYIIKTTGRKSGILKIIDKTNYSPYGKPQWWIRYYRPRVPTPQQHININKAITGINDPHTPISSMKATTVGAIGKVAEKANDYAPILTTAAIIYESCRVGKDVKKDFDHGTTRNTIKTVATTTATYTSGSVGASAGAAVGTLVAPGLGTIFGGIAGGLIGGYYGGYYGNVASERALDHVEWDHVTLECEGCKEEYTWKKYQEIEGVCCTPFKSRNQDTSHFWFNKLLVNHDF